MSKSKFIVIDAELEYAQVFEHNRDYGNGRDVDFTDEQGRYKVTLVIDQETKDYLVKNGVPETVLGYNQFQPVEGREGYYRFRVKRPHYNTKLEREFGPPNVVDANEVVEGDDGKQWYAQWPEDKLLGNGTKAKVKLSLFPGRAMIVTLESIAVTEHVEYEASEGVRF